MKWLCAPPPEGLIRWTYPAGQSERAIRWKHNKIGPFWHARLRSTSALPEVRLGIMNADSSGEPESRLIHLSRDCKRETAVEELNGARVSSKIRACSLRRRVLRLTLTALFICRRLFLYPWIRQKRPSLMLVIKEKRPTF